MSTLGANRGTKSLEIQTGGDVTLPQGPSDTVSGLKWSPTSDLLAVSSWDSSVRIYEVNSATGEGQGRALYNHEAPALCVGWWADGTKVFSGGCDNAVRSYDIATGQSVQIGGHDQAVSGVCLVDVGQPAVASVSWDKTLKYWDLRQPQPLATVQLPERAYSMSANGKLLVIGCAGLQIPEINLDQPNTIYKTAQSLLRHQSEAIACQSNGTGFAIGSIEGRCSIQYLNPQQSNQNFSFKCHRQTGQGTAAKPVDDVYTVSALDFHPVFNTLATGGGDGAFHVWDKDNKHRLGFTKRLGDPITALSFNSQGTLLAYANGYDWAKGHQYATPGKPPVVRVHKLNEWVVKPKTR